MADVYMAIPGYSGISGWSGTPFMGWSGISGYSGYRGIPCTHYFALWNGTAESNRFQMDFGTDPANIETILSRTVVRKKCLPGLEFGTSGAFVPGNTRVWDAGGGAGSESLLLTFKYATNYEYNWLYTNLYVPIATFLYSPDNGTTKYIVTWDGGDSLSFVPYQGDMTYGTMTLKLIVLKKL
jgi:hypothetical protein